MAHSRTKIDLITNKDVIKFVEIINSTGTIDKYVIENFDGTLRIDARSYLGVIYASAEFSDGGLFLVNLTNDGQIPAAIDTFRSFGD